MPTRWACVTTGSLNPLHAVTNTIWERLFALLVSISYVRQINDDFIFTEETLTVCAIQYLRSPGVRAVVQAMCVNEEQVSAFIKTLPGKDARCVVKPVQSAGSDDVFLCANEEEALTAFGRINGTMNGIGLQNTCVLVQEYLKGKEYVVDKVSRDGVHKLVGIWEYEKRSVNGANFVYFGMRLMDPSSEKMQIMVRYADKVLDALDIKHGPSHMEVMLDNWGTAEAPEFVPCLVEVGARCQGGEGTWLPMAKECIGYTPVSSISCMIKYYPTKS